MTDDAGAPTDPRAWLAAVGVDAAVLELRPDYRAVLLTADGLRGGPSDAVSERMLAAAEASARRQLDGRPPEQLPHPAAWREAYRAFGAKPQRTRPSVEALLRRLDPLTDDDVSAAADALTGALLELSPGAVVHRRLLPRSPHTDGDGSC